ncbi:hypothetical protein TSAR_002382 [Trichomalopsis sarcophagae]|uniref:Uncharacterized protein n=1 Tax=Trichomalopsis sarcophagae TaxID=543379 RepID=A0A232FIG5_9HYME|nr:hypothetical protein TSAR_002382 [Trichomalopsis sarcophagae]
MKESAARLKCEERRKTNKGISEIIESERLLDLRVLIVNLWVIPVNKHNGTKIFIALHGTNPQFISRLSVA